MWSCSESEMGAMLAVIDMGLAEVLCVCFLAENTETIPFVANNVFSLVYQRLVGLSSTMGKYVVNLISRTRTSSFIRRSAV